MESFSSVASVFTVANSLYVILTLVSAKYFRGDQSVLSRLCCCAHSIVNTTGFQLTHYCNMPPIVSLLN